MTSFLLAQTDAPTWFSVVLHGGSFALLAYIVTVMYPKAAADARAEREGRDAKFAELIEKISDQFDTRNEKIVDAITKSCRANCANFSPKCEQR